MDFIGFLKDVAGFWWILLKIVGPAEACLRGGHNFRSDQQDTAGRWAGWHIFNGFWWYFGGFLMVFNAFLWFFNGY